MRIDNIHAIVAALDTLKVPRSGGRRTPAPLVAPADSVADVDDRLFAEVEKANTAEAYAYYLGELPQGRQAPVAKFRLHALRPPLPSGRQHEERVPADERRAQAAEAKSQRWSPPRPALLVACGVVGIGVVLALAWWGRPPPEPAKSPPAVTPPAATAVTPPAVTAPATTAPAATPPAVTPPAVTRPNVAEMSGAVPLTLARERALNPKDTFRECAGCPEMVVVPAGEFMMGSLPSEEGHKSDEGPVRKVSIQRPFAVAKNSVTRGEFAAFVQETGHKTEGGCFTWDGTGWKRQADKSWRSPGFPQDDRHPVVCVNWDDAKAYARWLSDKTGKTYRLLTEREREYATRGVTTATPQPRYHFGNDAGDLCKYANGGDQTAKKTFPDWTLVPCEDGFVYTSPVGSFGPNAFGLHDMHGNVWNWTEDCWNGDCGRRVVRGGAWNNNPQVLRAASRIGYPPQVLRAASGIGYPADGRSSYLGFRVGRTLTP